MSALECRRCGGCHKSSDELYACRGLVVEPDGIFTTADEREIDQLRTRVRELEADNLNLRREATSREMAVRLEEREHSARVADRDGAGSMLHANERATAFRIAAAIRARGAK